MIVVAIIGILAAFALPAYQDYISKTQTTRVVGELAAAKTAVDAAIFNGKIPAFKDDSASTPQKENIGLTSVDADHSSTDTRSNLLSQVDLTGDFITLASGEGVISGILGKNANIDIKGIKVSHKRSKEGVWSCELSESSSGWKQKFTPNGCTSTATKK